MICGLKGVTGSGGHIGRTVFALNQGTYQARNFRTSQNWFQPPGNYFQNQFSNIMHRWTTDISSGQRSLWNTWAASASWEWGLQPTNGITGTAWWFRNIYYGFSTFEIYDPSFDPSNWGDLPTLIDNGGSYYDGSHWQINCTVNRNRANSSNEFAIYCSTLENGRTPPYQPNSRAVVQGSSYFDSFFDNPINVPTTIAVRDFYSPRAYIPPVWNIILQVFATNNLSYPVVLTVPNL